MTDNVSITAGTGTTIATDDIAGVQVQRVKATWGPDGTMNDADVASGKALPVQLRSSGGSELALATLAKQPALGTAGSASIDVITVQGIASGTSLNVALAAGAAAIAKAEDAASADADVGVPALAVRKASPANTSGTDGDYEFLQMSAGRLWSSTNIDQINGVTPLMGAGNTGTGSPRVTIATDQVTIPVTATLVSRAASAAVTLTRTADTNAYAANDVLGAATGSTAALTFASMGPSAAEVTLTSASLEIDASGIISGETSYRLYLYNVTPPSATGDNGAWDLPSGDRASFLGYVDLGVPVDLGSTLYVQTDNIGKQIKLSGTSIFAYLVTNGAYTPTSARVHVITLHTVY